MNGFSVANVMDFSPDLERKGVFERNLGRFWYSIIHRKLKNAFAIEFLFIMLATQGLRHIHGRTQ